MTTFAWFLLIAICAVSLASMAVQGWVGLRGEKRTAFIGALVVCATGGAVIASEVSREPGYIALGAVIGLGLVELGPHVLRGLAAIIRGVSGRIGRGE